MRCKFVLSRFVLCKFVLSDSCSPFSALRFVLSGQSSQVSAFESCFHVCEFRFVLYVFVAQVRDHTFMLATVWFGSQVGALRFICLQIRALQVHVLVFVFSEFCAQVLALRSCSEVHAINVMPAKMALSHSLS